MSELAYLNGDFCSLAQAQVSIEDRGFQFGDGVYEVIVAYGGKLFELESHLARLRTSLDAIDLDFDLEKAGVVDAIRDGLRRCEFPDVMVYLQITRGAAPRMHAIPTGLTPTVVMTFKSMPSVPPGLRARGMKLKTVPDDRWANCYIKAITLLPNVLAKTRAQRAGFDDALFVTTDGRVRECTSSNIYIVEGDLVSFPQRNESVLHGVTQRFLAGCAGAIGLGVKEDVIPLERLLAADEVFISSTAVEVLAVTSVDGRTVATGKVGPVARRLHGEFLRRARSQ